DGGPEAVCCCFHDSDTTSRRQVCQPDKHASYNRACRRRTPTRGGRLRHPRRARADGQGWRRPMSRNLRDSLLDILLDVQHGRATVYEAADRIEAVASTPSAEVSTDDIVEAVRPRVRCDRCGEAGRPIARISKGMALCGPCWQVTGGAPATEEAPGGAFDKALSEATEALGVRSRRGS